MTTRQKILSIVGFTPTPIHWWWGNTLVWGFTLCVRIFLFAQDTKDYERLKKSVYEIEKEIKKIHLPFDTIVPLTPFPANALPEGERELR